MEVRRCTEETMGTRNVFDHVDIVLKISEYLDMKSYVRFRTTSRVLLEILPDKAPAFVKKWRCTDENTPQQNESLLIVIEKTYSVYNKFDSTEMYQILWQSTLIDLSLTQLSDISVLSGLQNLTELNLAETKVSNISLLSTLSNLRILCLQGTQITNISGLSTLTKLQKLYLSRTQISEISSLSTLKNLKELDLSRTLITDISAFSTLNNLEFLYLDYCNVQMNSVLLNLIKLKALYVDESNLVNNLVFQELDRRGVMVFFSR
mmetsp:Transcript_10949/g.19790  ORF Transcript_10949/g.19790 Transcript_10949/m.19790 type:complete len:263 (-) Transcript_10949:247-1035(-)